MSTVEQVEKVREEMYTRSLELVRKKGQDYNRTSQAGGDTLGNIRACEKMDWCPAELGVLIRLLDKINRLESLIHGPPANADESFEDTVLDVHNYVDYLVVLRREKHGTLINMKEDMLIDREAREAIHRLRKLAKEDSEAAQQKQANQEN